MNLHIRNVSPALYERLSHHARVHNRTIDAVVLAAAERELQRREWAERFATRSETDLGVAAASLLKEVRREIQGRDRFTPDPDGVAPAGAP